MWRYQGSQVEYQGSQGESVTPSSLSRLASLLFPPLPSGKPTWQTNLACALRNPYSQRGVDPRLVRRWACGDKPVPAWVKDEMIRLLWARLEEIEMALGIHEIS